MVTNINLVSPEEKSQTKISGGTSLALSVFLLIVAVGAYLALALFSASYQRQESSLESKIQEEKAKISGPEFSDVADFQGKLDLLEKITDNHVYLDSFLKNLSKFMLPDVRLKELQWDYDKNSLALSGVAPNFDALAREIILLKNYSFIQSVEFKNATQSTGSEQAGVQFELSAQLAKEAYNK